MPLSAEQQALFDHARRALPRWLTRGKTAVLEWLHAYTQTFDSVRAQGQDWLDITYLDNATGAELDQHALDRGTFRRDGEDDDTLRERIRNITDVVTVPALKSGVDALLAASALGPSNWVVLRRDRAHFQKYYRDYPNTAVLVNTALGFGNWATNGFGWAINETSGSLTPALGGVSLTPTSVTYGPGPHAADSSISFSAATGNASGGNIVNIGSGSDFIAWALIRINSLPPATRTIISKWGGVGSAGWQISLRNTGEVVFQGLDSAGAVIFTSNATPPTGVWVLVMATIDRATSRARLSYKPIGGAVGLGVQQTIAAGFNGSGNLTLGDRADATGIAATTVDIASAYAVSGTSVATGLEASMTTALTNLENYLYPKWERSRYLSRGYRISYPQTPMGYIVILPFGTTAAMGEAVQEYLRQYGPAGFYYTVEIRGVP